jgi:RNA-directed DNA polymerase
MNKTILREFIKAGFVEGFTFHETAEGTPQGGIISPILANMVLDGMEKALGKEYPLVRYADDFVVLGGSKEKLEKEATPRIEKFLMERGLSLNLEKTKIVDVVEGFDFLGFNFREYPDISRVKGTKQGIFLVKPAATKIKNFRSKIKELVKSHKGKPMYVLVTKLNQVLRG